MQAATEAYFVGTWRMSRVVRAADGPVIAWLDGTLVFAPAGRVLRAEEAGVLRTGGATYPARLATFWHFDGASVSVAFEDGRPFHAFSAGSPAALHRCGDDLYRVRYRFGPDAFAARWRVSGPAKNYAMTTLHRRIPYPPDPSCGRCGDVEAADAL